MSLVQLTVSTGSVSAILMAIAIVGKAAILLLRIHIRKLCVGASHVELVVKNLPASAGDIREMGSIPRSGRFPGNGVLLC